MDCFSESLSRESGGQAAGGVLTKNAANQHEVLEENLYISEDGYTPRRTSMETFVINETSEDVWFDDFMVMSTTSPIMQETHYSLSR